jgi:hypothetical protein
MRRRFWRGEQERAQAAPETANGESAGAQTTSTVAAREREPAERPGPVREAPASDREPRRFRRGRAREAGAATVGAVGSGALALARLVLLAASLIALLIVLAIVLVDVDANRANSIVKGIHEGGNFFAGAFTGLIKFSGHSKRAITVDWGIAVLVYLFAGALFARLVGGVGRGWVRFERRHRAAPSH